MPGRLPKANPYKSRIQKDIMDRNSQKMDMRGFGWRVSLSVLVSIGWLAFLVIWLFFYAGDYSIYQNLAVFLASILIVAAIMGASWASWGIRQKHGWECCIEEGSRKPKKEGRRIKDRRRQESPSNENPPSGKEAKPPRKKRSRK
jgi:hypothetical protein